MVSELQHNTILDERSDNILNEILFQAAEVEDVAFRATSSDTAVNDAVISPEI